MWVQTRPASGRFLHSFMGSADEGKRPVKRTTKRGVSVALVVGLIGILTLAQANAQTDGSAPATGEAYRGEELFTGGDSLQNGGPACMACHSVAGLDALGGGGLAPDLTARATQLGDQGLSAMLTPLTQGQAPFSPTMQPVFDTQQLTPQEVADISAFLAQTVATKRPAGATASLFGISAGGAIVLLILAGIVWHRHLKGVRKRMVAESKLPALQVRKAS